MASHNDLGNRGERIAVDFLKSKEYEILARNWRHQRAEIDIIAKYGNTLVVVEVKTQSSTYFKQPKEAVTINKQQHLIRATNTYIEENNIDWDCRFDVISILLEKENIQIEHLEDAFTV